MDKGHPGHPGHPGHLKTRRTVNSVGVSMVMFLPLQFLDTLFVGLKTGVNTLFVGLNTGVDALCRTDNWSGRPCWTHFLSD